MSNRRQHTKQYLEHRYRLFCRLQKPSEIYDLLRINVERYKTLTDNPPYQIFTIGKKSGGERRIENPRNALKKVQNRLNDYLQAVYYCIKTPIAYGFIINSTREKDRRDIFANARRHFGQPYLLNLDLKDFFHSIEVPRIWKMLGQTPFRFQRPAFEALTRLVTYKGRLPMGAPTSPVISNLVMRAVDKDLEDYAKTQDMTVTRYADDITFSSQYEITQEMFTHIKALIEAHEFKLNESKIKWFAPEDTKEVTGILLLEGDKLGLPDGYFTELEDEIIQLATVMLVQNRQGKLNTNWVDTFKKHLRGKLNFMGQVIGKNTKEYQDLSTRLNQASLPPPEEFGSYSWQSFHYHT